MKLESVKCPNCGAPVVALNADGTVMCRACSSLLHVIGGKSGMPTVRPIDTGEDLSFFRTLQTADSLREKLAELDAEEKRLPVEQPAKEGSGCAVCFVVLIGLGLLLSAYSACRWMPGGCPLLSFSSRLSYSREQSRSSPTAVTRRATKCRENAAAARQKRKQVQEQKQRIERQIAALERKLDELTSNM